MRAIILFATSVAVTFFLHHLPVQAQESEQPAIELTVDERERLKFVSNRGLQLLQNDDAAWVATDRLMVDTNDNPKDAGVSGWISQKLADGTLRVTFIERREDGLYAAHQSIVDGREILSTQFFEDRQARPKLSEDETRLFNARFTAVTAIADEGLCTPTINSAVIPTPAGLEVYLLGPETKENTVRMGRHYRVLVGSDGKADAPQKFTNGCVLLEKTENSIGLTVTHLLSDIPTEIHVFQSLRHQTPIFVLTTQNNRLWKVSGSEIQLIKTIGE